jgi:hypothetical protein
VLAEFDKNKLTVDVMKQIEQVIIDPEYSIEKAMTASQAARGIF